MENQLESNVAVDLRVRTLPHKMETCDIGTTNIRVRGKTIQVPTVCIDKQVLIVTGRWIKMAGLKDEQLVEGRVVENPGNFIDGLKRSKLGADIFTFTQKLTDPTPRHPFPFEWDNLAVVPITTFQDWWEKRLPQESRKNVRRAEKRGVLVKEVPFNDDLVRGIQGIYNETPVRQGRRFWHFGKPFEAVKLENATYLERSDFIGAYFHEELIGFIKIIHVDRVATLIQILAKNEHRDKRPMNALLANAIRLCEQKGASFLVYGKYAYDGNRNSALAEFKRRNGFEEVKIPRYFVSITLAGRLAIKLKLHRGIKGWMPLLLLRFLLNARSEFHRRAERSAGHTKEPTSNHGAPDR